MAVCGRNEERVKEVVKEIESVKMRIRKSQTHYSMIKAEWFIK